MRLIDADSLGREVFSHSYSVPILENENKALSEVLVMIHNAPTITIKEWVAEMPDYIKRAMLDALLNDIK